MAKKNIGAALAAIVGDGQAESRTLAMYIARWLSAASASKVNSIDSKLGLQAKAIWLRVNKFNSSDIDRRRASILVCETLQPKVLPPDSLDPNDDRGYLANAKRFAGYNGISGPFLMGSYWAYSSHADRDKTMAAYAEAKLLLLGGITAVKDLTNGKNATNFVRWFGRPTPAGGPARSPIVLEKLKRTLDGLNAKKVGFIYAGPSHGTWPTLQETNAGELLGQTEVTSMPGLWGHARYAAGNDAFICLGGCFFNSVDTSSMRTQLHTLGDLRPMEVSRGGAVLHEATHAMAETDDVIPSTELGNLLASLPQGAKRGATKVFGPEACYQLAQFDDANNTAEATRNADNYRLFCEDAYV